MSDVKYYELSIDGVAKTCIPNDGHVDRTVAYTKMILHRDSSVTIKPLVFADEVVKPVGDFGAAEDMVFELEQQNKKLHDLLRLAAMSARTLRADDRGLADHSGFLENFVVAMEEESGLDHKTGYGATNYQSQRDVLNKYGYL